jgi:hypothetical protein
LNTEQALKGDIAYNGQFYDKKKGGHKSSNKPSLKNLRKSLLQKSIGKSLMMEAQNIVPSTNQLMNKGSELQSKEGIDYGEGIRVMRLNFEGRILEIFSDDEEDELEQETEEDPEQVQLNSRLRSKFLSNKKIKNNRKSVLRKPKIDPSGITFDIAKKLRNTADIGDTKDIPKKLKTLY